MRPAFSFKRESATQQRRLFAGPFLPGRLARTKVVPDIPGLRLQAVHTADVADAYVRALTLPVRGAFNLAAEPVLGPPELANLLGATLVRVPARPARAGLALAWALRLVPVPAYLFDAVLRMPLMDISRAHRELGWSAEHSSIEAIGEFLSGLQEGAGAATAPLAPDSGIAGRIREAATGVGKR
jgi:nucleoside-diphosphate-sugar epimerase